MKTETPWIQWENDDSANEQIANIYRQWKKANPSRDRFPEILKCFSGNASVLKGILDFCYPLQFCDGALTRSEKELIATLVSALNLCKY